MRQRLASRFEEFPGAHVDRPNGLVYTEQIVFLDAPEHLEDRKKGTEALFDNLVAALAKAH